MRYFAFLLLLLARFVYGADADEGSAIKGDPPTIQLAQAGVNNLNFIIPLEFESFVPCALDGVGENVILSGNFHINLHTTFDSSGGFHVVARGNDQNIHGFGETSGDHYVGTGVAGFSLNAASPGTFVCATVLNFGIIGKRTPSVVLANFHLTINSLGEVTAIFGGQDEARFVCSEDEPEVAPNVSTCEPELLALAFESDITN